MTFKLLAEKHLEFLSLKGGCTGSSESTLVKIPDCCGTHIVAHMYLQCISAGSCMYKIWSVQSRCLALILAYLVYHVFETFIFSIYNICFGFGNM